MQRLDPRRMRSSDGIGSQPVVNGRPQETQCPNHHFRTFSRLNLLEGRDPNYLECFMAESRPLFLAMVYIWDAAVKMSTYL